MILVKSKSGKLVHAADEHKGKLKHICRDARTSTYAKQWEGDPKEVTCPTCRWLLKRDGYL